MLSDGRTVLGVLGEPYRTEGQREITSFGGWRAYTAARETAPAADTRVATVAGAEPYAFAFPLRATALLMVDFQRDFVAPGGFGEALGNDVSLLRGALYSPE